MAREWWYAFLALPLVCSCGEEHITRPVDWLAPVVGPVEWAAPCSIADRTVVLTIADSGWGVDWNTVYVDIYNLEYLEDLEDDRFPYSALVHVVTPEMIASVNGDCREKACDVTIPLYSSEWKRLRFVIYGSWRNLRMDETCDCRYVEYSLPNGGIRDLAGNHAAVSVQDYDYDATICD